MRAGPLVALAVLLGTIPSGSFGVSPAQPAFTAEPTTLAIAPEEARGRITVGAPARAIDHVPAHTPGERAIAPPPETFDAPAAAPAPPPVALRTAPALGPPPAGGVWAVIIGIDDYPGTRSDLRASVNDANDVDAALAAYGVPGDRRLVLRNTQATAATIADALRWLVARSSPDATAVFFYAGHVRKPRGGGEAIVAADGNLVYDRDVADLLRPLAARRTWIAMASCYAGGFSEVLGPGRILTGASDANSWAYENSTYGRSYLVEFMIRRAMLEGHAAGSVEQAYAYAYGALAAEHPNRMPVQYDLVDGELRLGTPPPKAPPPKQSPPPPDERQSEPAPSNPSRPPEDDDDDCLIVVGPFVGCRDR